MRSKFELPQNSTLKMSVWLHPNLLLIFIPKKPQPVTQQEPNILGLREPSSFRFSSSLNSLLKLLGVSWWCFFFSRICCFGGNFPIFLQQIIRAAAPVPAERGECAALLASPPRAPRGGTCRAAEIAASPTEHAGKHFSSRLRV